MHDANLAFVSHFCIFGLPLLVYLPSVFLFLARAERCLPCVYLPSQIFFLFLSSDQVRLRGVQQPCLILCLLLCFSLETCFCARFFSPPISSLFRSLSAYLLSLALLSLAHLLLSLSLSRARALSLALSLSRSLALSLSRSLALCVHLSLTFSLSPSSLSLSRHTSMHPYIIHQLSFSLFLPL
jgi:hypothetical protein